MLDLKEERRFARLRKLGQELCIPTPEAFLTLEVLDKSGKLIQKQHQRSHSWVENAYNQLFQSLAGVGGLAADNLDQYTTAGVQKASAFSTWFEQTVTKDMTDPGYGYRGGAGINTHGIVVGSGNTAEVFDSSNPLGYALETLIAEGAVAGQLNYAQQEAYVITFLALVKTATQIRYMNNNSGGNVSVNEVGLIGRYSMAFGANQKMMVSRDVLGGTITVPDTGQLKVTYTFQLTYPS